MVYRGIPTTCRACREAMTAETHLDIAYERCPRCLSVWIDPVALGGLWTKMQPLRPLTFEARDAGTIERSCPTCDKVMAAVVLPFAVPVERCEAHGVWLDTDELGVTLAAAYLDPAAWWRDFGKLVRTFT